MDLTDKQIEALHQLDRKRRGQPIPFVNIADAQGLTALGMATRNQEGWVITAAGVAHLAEIGHTEPPSMKDHGVIGFAPAAGDGPSDDGVPAERPSASEEMFDRWADLQELLAEQLKVWKLAELGVETVGAIPPDISADELEARIASFDRSLRSAFSRLIGTAPLV